MHMYRLNGTAAAIELAFKLAAESIKEYRRGWRLYLGIVALGWWPIIAFEVWAIAWLAEPVLTRIEPVLFRFSSLDRFDARDAFADLDLNAIRDYFALTLGILVFQTLLAQNMVIGALIKAAAGRAAGAAHAFAQPPLRYLSLVGVSLLTALCVALPSFATLALLFGLLLVAPELTGLSYLLGAALLVGSVLLLIPSVIFFTLRFALGPQTVVLEGRTALGAVCHSWRLIKGWPGFLCVFALTVLLAGPNVILGLLIPQLERSLGWMLAGGAVLSSLHQYLLSHALSNLLVGLLLPFQAITLTLLYRYLTGAHHGVSGESEAPLTGAPAAPVAPPQ